MNAQGRTLALDVGDRRIGLAITDELNLTAQPLFTVHRTTPKADLKSINRFIRSRGVTALVVGLPLHANGAHSPQAEKTKAFAASLQELHPDLPLHFLDERHTTQQAHALLDQTGHNSRAAGHSERIARQDIIDQVAATLLLEAFLARQNGPALLPDPDAP